MSANNPNTISPAGAVPNNKIMAIRFKGGRSSACNNIPNAIGIANSVQKPNHAVRQMTTPCNCSQGFTADPLVEVLLYGIHFLEIRHPADIDGSLDRVVPARYRMVPPLWSVWTSTGTFY